MKNIRVFWKKGNGQQQKNDKTERSRGLSRKDTRRDRKEELNDSPEIPNKDKTSDITGHIEGTALGFPVVNRIPIHLFQWPGNMTNKHADKNNMQWLEMWMHR